MFKIQKVIIVFLIVLALFTGACKKDDTIIANATTLNVINALEGSSGLLTNVNNQLPYLAGQPSIGYGSYRLYSFTGGQTHIALTDVADTTQTVYTGASFDLPANTVHSLFLSGAFSSPDTLLVTDNLTSYGGKGGADSVTGIRFVNLSLNSNISINIQGQPDESEVSNLNYKGITGFKNYPATSSINSYTFEFRDQATGDLLATYTLKGVNNGAPGGSVSTNTVIFKDHSIIFYGIPGSQKIFLVNNY